MKKKNGDYSSTNKQTNQEKHWAKEEGKEEEQHKSQPLFLIALLSLSLGSSSSCSFLQLPLVSLL
jgi:hypothetical protein